MLWKTVLNLEALNAFTKKTIHNSLGIQITKLGENYLEGTMPVDERTHQPYGILHGGASVVLAESLGSLAGYLAASSHGDKTTVGIDIHATHLRSIRSGSVTGRAYPIRLGKSIHVWEIKIFETGHEDAGMICWSKLTLAVRDTPAKKK